jgi:transcriptional regulator with XRE-family HTH domain
MENFLWAAWLKSKLEAKGWSIDDLAEVTRLNRSTIYHYTTDRSRPTKKSLFKICEALAPNTEAAATFYAEAITLFSSRRVGRPRTA